MIAGRKWPDGFSNRGTWQRSNGVNIRIIIIKVCCKTGERIVDELI
jgi:hypothetical protein